MVGLTASPSTLTPSGGSTTLRWTGNQVADYMLKVSPTAGVSVDGTAYAGPIDLNTATTATAALPSNGGSASTRYTFTLTATDASGAALTPGKTTVLVPVPPQGLWVPDYGTNSIHFFAAGTLGTTSKAAATISKGIKNARAVAIDANGNLWTANDFAGTITEYAADTLTADPSPAATIASGTGVRGLAFDASGNLWVTNFYADTAVEYPAASLSSNPAVSRSIGGLHHPESLAFDASGNLWIANWGNNTVTEYTAASLSSTPTLGATISKKLSQPEGLAFDASGNLWVGNESGGVVLRYAASGLTAGPGPAAIITTGVPDNVGVTLDASGNLWVTHQNDKVDEYAAADVVSTGSPTPIHTLSGMSATSQMPAFDPPPSTLPLYQ